MPTQKIRKAERWTVATFVRRFPEVHLAVGLLGNALFITGTILFITKYEHIGLYFFLAGSCGMFLGSLGEIIRTVGRRSLERHDVDPRYPNHRWSEQHSSASVLD